MEGLKDKKIERGREGRMERLKNRKKEGWGVYWFCLCIDNFFLDDILKKRVVFANKMQKPFRSFYTEICLITLYKRGFYTQLYLVSVWIIKYSVPL
jgi:hypothetical protein